MLEEVVEDDLKLGVRLLGGLAEKYTSPGRRGVPDELVSWQEGIVHFVETKRPGKDAEEHQKRDHARRRANGHVVLVLNTRVGVAAYLEVCQHLIKTQDWSAMRDGKRWQTWGERLLNG